MQYSTRKSLKVNKDSKLIIALGDSFVEGQGAVSKETWQKYDWSEPKMTSISPCSDEFKSLREEEHNNAFVNVLCKKHFPDYTPINLGYRGNGNRATVKALTTLHPDLNLGVAKEKIVIFFVGQMVRFDFFNNKLNNTHNYFHTVWPAPTDSEEIGIQNLWNGYATEVYSPVTAALEVISNIVEVQNWCKLNNGKLLLVNSFTYDFEREKLIDALTDFTPGFKDEDGLIVNLVDTIDWSNLAMLPKGRKQMVDVLLDRENRHDLAGLDHLWYFWPRELKNFTPKGLMTPCSHPSPKGHQLIAKVLAKEIKEKKLNV